MITERRPSGYPLCQRGIPSLPMTPARERPPYLADERTQLVGWLDLQRAIIHWKCEGLSGADAHRSVLPASPHMTMAGVVTHLRWAECRWFEVVFLGRPAEGRPWERGPDEAQPGWPRRAGEAHMVFLPQAGRPLQTWVVHQSRPRSGDMQPPMHGWPVGGDVLLE